jgi:hypothetical protein
MPGSLVAMITPGAGRDHCPTASIAHKLSSPDFDFAQPSGPKLGDELAEGDVPPLYRREPMPAGTVADTALQGEGKNLK